MIVQVIYLTAIVICS